MRRAGPVSDFDDAVLDDADELQRRDADAMLRAIATAGAQVREALLMLPDDVFAGLAEDGRPRAVLLAGAGNSGIVGDIAAAVAGRACPVPVLSERGSRLPGWVGAMDLVVAVSASGVTPDTLTVVDEALRRGARVVTVGAASSPLAARADQSPAVHLSVDARGRLPRSNVWALLVPVLRVLDVLQLLDAPTDRLEQVADRLDAASAACGPAVETFDNPAKRLALSLAGSLPYVWGSSELAGVAARRFVAQLATNARYPAAAGVLPEAHRESVAVIAGRFGALASGPEDIFRDPFEDGEVERVRLKILLLRDTDEMPEAARRREATWSVADRFGVPVEEVAAEGEHPLERLATLLAPLEFASVYLALLQGIDPSPIEPIALLNAASATRTQEDDR
jgi:glucose/mannose-6-phosphate isomerase